jgi:hypothetical protein
MLTSQVAEPGMRQRGLEQLAATFALSEQPVG